MDKIAFNSNYYSPPTTTEGENLAYDLRQIYAQLVGESLQDITRARKSDNYNAYFKCLKDAWIITQHKIKEKKKDAPELFTELFKKAIKIMNDNANALSKGSTNNIGKAKIESVLDEIEMFLYDCLNAAGIFGSKWDDDGL